MGYAQLVIGPAGSGKSTYCSNLYRHCETVRRSINIVNLDPAAENFDYPAAVDIRELINMEELGLGPNGGLIYCMEELEDNLDDWLTEKLDDFADDYWFMTDVTEFISGCLSSLSAMVQLEVPHVNILSKMDLVKNKKDLEDFLNHELSLLNRQMAPQFQDLNKALINMVNAFGMVSFIPLDLRKNSIEYVLSQIDVTIQYGEDADVKVEDFDFDPDDDD